MALLGISACNVANGAVAPVPWDISSMCYVDPPLCTTDSCNDTEVVSCARGVSFTVDCASVGLGTCQLVKTDLGTQTHAACTAP
jgi:hypothetical protein